MNHYEIKRYDKQYIQQCIQLILGIQTSEFSIPISIDDQPDLMDIENFYQRGNGNFWIALKGNDVVGTIALIDIGNDEVALRKMFVDKAFRGKDIGVAQALLSAAMDWCRERQVQGIFLGTTAAYLAAHRFYEKNGFALVDRSELPKAFPVMAVDSRFYRKKI